MGQAKGACAINYRNIPLSPDKAMMLQSKASGATEPRGTNLVC